MDVPYNILPRVQGWLNIHKYSLLEDQISSDQVELAANEVNSALAVRYDTSTWTNEDNTPEMALQLITMLTASYTLRKAISEDDGQTRYCDWLEKRVRDLLLGLTTGVINIPGTDPDPNAPASASIEFFPTEAATTLWLEDGNVEGAAARYFDYQKVF